MSYIIMCMIEFCWCNSDLFLFLSVCVVCLYFCLSSLFCYCCLNKWYHFGWFCVKIPFSLVHVPFLVVLIVDCLRHFRCCALFSSLEPKFHWDFRRKSVSKEQNSFERKKPLSIKNIPFCPIVDANIWVKYFSFLWQWLQINEKNNYTIKILFVCWFLFVSFNFCVFGMTAH